MTAPCRQRARPATRPTDPNGAATADLVLLLGRVAHGDEAALRQLYSRTSSKLFGVCLQVLDDRAMAEDALQEAFLAIWRNAHRFDPQRAVSPITWMATIARNRAIDRLRSSKPHVEQPLSKAMAVVDPHPPSDQRLIEADAGRDLQAALAGIDPGEADLIRQAFFGGMTHVALATVSGVPLGTLKSRIRRALGRLRVHLIEQQPVCGAAG